MTKQLGPDDIESFSRVYSRLFENIRTVIRGKDQVIQLALVCLFAEGHLLLEDFPGVGKTSLAKSIAASIRGTMRRVQFTPDLLPSDITGVKVYDLAAGVFEFHEGPVFANILLADEINRTSPKVQSALLEVMEERQVTVDGTERALERPFVVIATMNPLDLDGTYALPEAQLDRFMIKTSIGYPDHDAELAVLEGRVDGRPIEESLVAVSDIVEVAHCTELCRRVEATSALRDYVVRLTSGTRHSDQVKLGASPRGSLMLLQASQAYALSMGRSYVTAEDIRALAPYVLSHRIILTAEADREQRRKHDVISELVMSVPPAFDPPMGGL